MNKNCIVIICQHINCEDEPVYEYTKLFNITLNQTANEHWDKILNSSDNPRCRIDARIITYNESGSVIGYQEHQREEVASLIYHPPLDPKHY